MFGWRKLVQGFDVIGDILIPDKAAQMLKGRTVEGREALLADTICFVREL